MPDTLRLWSGLFGDALAELSTKRRNLHAIAVRMAPVNCSPGWMLTNWRQAYLKENGVREKRKSGNARLVKKRSEKQKRKPA